jgi:hypothetical protein
MDFSAMAPIAILKSSHTFRDTMNYWYNANKCEIWQAARCTSADPSFFRTMFVDVPAPGSWYIDGGLCHNNPSPCNTLSFSESTRMITLLRADWPIPAIRLWRLPHGIPHKQKAITILKFQFYSVNWPIAMVVRKKKSSFNVALNRMAISSPPTAVHHHLHEILISFFI